MPAPGQANNGLGINSFSGPMGEKEQPYGAVERLKVLTSLAPPGSPQAVDAPRRAKRAALRGKRLSQPASAPETPAPAVPPSPAQPDYQTQMVAFWQQLAAQPGASDQVKQYAAEVLGG